MKKERNVINIVAPIIFLVVLLGVWQLVTKVFRIDMTVLPSPVDIGIAFKDKFIGIILPDLWITVKDIVIGYCIAVPLGLLIAALCSQSKIAVKIATPLVIMLLVTPMMALIPIFMLFLGFNTSVKIIVVVLQTMPIIILNSLTGFSNVQKFQLDLMSSYGCSRLEVFIKATFMNALPEVFGGLKLGCVLCTIGAVSADIGVGRGGVGTRIQTAASVFATDTVFATIIVTCIVGIILFEIVSRIERVCLNWK